MRYRAILFDMDGVLVDSESLMAKVGVATLRAFGVEAKETDFAEFVGTGEDSYIGGVSRKYGVPYDPVMKQHLYVKYGELVKTENVAAEKATEVLQTLRARGYKLAVCSSADREKVGYNLEAVGVADAFFDAVVTGSEIENLKPAPDIYLKGAELVGALPEECLVVEDAPSGIKAAHAGGMRAVGITSSFPRETLREKAAPDYIIDKLTQLLEIV